VFGAAGVNGHLVRTNRFTIRIKYPDLQMCFFVGGIEDANAFMARHFRFGTVAGFGNIAFADGPALMPNGRKYFFFV
jgi:hypothetical protein